MAYDPARGPDPGTHGLGRWAPLGSLTVLGVFLVVFWQWQSRLWEMHTLYATEIRGLAVAVRDLAEEVRRDRERERRGQ